MRSGCLDRREKAGSFEINWNKNRYSDGHITENMIKAVIVILLNTKEDILKMGYGAQITLNHIDFHCMDKNTK